MLENHAQKIGAKREHMALDRGGLRCRSSPIRSDVDMERIVRPMHSDFVSFQNEK